MRGALSSLNPAPALPPKHMQLDEVTLANRPEAVGAFMEHLRAAIRPKCEEEMGRLQVGQWGGARRGGAMSGWGAGGLQRSGPAAGSHSCCAPRCTY